MVDIKEVVVPPIWEKINIFLKLQDDAGSALSGIGYVIYTDHEERRGITTEEGVIEEKGVAGKDYWIELEDGSTIVFEEGASAGPSNGAVDEDGTADGGEDPEKDDISLEDFIEEVAELDDDEEQPDDIEDIPDELSTGIDEEADIEEAEE